MSIHTLNRPAVGVAASEVPTSPAKATRTPASGACRCARHSCWHARDCKSSGVVRILRAPKIDGGPTSSVVLCRECAAPTRRTSVA